MGWTMATNNVGTVFRRKSGRHKGMWVARIELAPDKEGKRKRRDFQFDTQARARAKLDEMREDLKKGREPALKSKAPTLAEYLDYWLENRVEPRVSPNTYAR